MFTRAKPLPDVPRKPEEYAQSAKQEHSIHDLPLSDLRAFHDQVGTVLAQRTAQAREDFRKDFLSKLDLYGMSLEDLRPQPEKKERKQREVKAKYRDPATGETWTGRGKTKPLWMQAYLAQGRQIEEFLIDGASPAATEPA
jgi:DNA-binding protein H-NS